VEKFKKIIGSERSICIYLFENKQMQIPRFARNDRLGDFFTPSCALGYSMPPLTGLRKAGAHEKSILNESLAQTLVRDQWTLF
jgi:hypothetical protein